MAEKNLENILIIGSGGREDALCWKLRQSVQVGKIYISPGNGGSTRFKNTFQTNLDLSNIKKLIAEIKRLQILLVVIGPEAPLVNGISDKLKQNKILVYGPSKKSARLEGSKSFAVRFMRKYNIPHPRSRIFSNFQKAKKFLSNPPRWLKKGIVVKADGLAAGKGVFVCSDKNEALPALKQIMVDKKFGSAGDTVVIQEKLSGFEMSCMVIADGINYSILPYTEDHKQAYDNDCGPNTGGMGVVAPHSSISKNLSQRIEKEIIKPTILNMRKNGSPFCGTLYPGLMITKGGPKVLEYNVRFGDPEIEAVVPLLSDRIDFYTVLKNAARQRLKVNNYYPVKKDCCVVVTLASGGYPLSYKTGILIKGLDKFQEKKDLLVFHAGTKKENKKYLTEGGRVLMAAAVGKSLDKARQKAYKAIGSSGITFKNMHFRKDIGKRKKIFF